MELQLRLAGFRGTLPDGECGPGTELQVKTIQRDFMQLVAPTGIADVVTFEAIEKFAKRFPADFATLRSPCGVCTGFGQQQFKGLYIDDVNGVEQFHRYEHPCIHRMILWSARALFAYIPAMKFTFTSGYRCSFENLNKQRTTTNHHGKAVDIDIVSPASQDKRDDMERCNAVRGLLVEKSNAQIGWVAKNRKSLEPADIAPTWVHYDVRECEPKYLKDEFFCKDSISLDRPIHLGK